MAEDLSKELNAIKIIQEALEPLESGVRVRVLDYVFRVLGIRQEESQARPLATVSDQPHVNDTLAVTPLARTGEPIDILSLKDEKQPTNNNQMVALVAFYLAHVSQDERRNYITDEDLRKYFIQGKFPIPGSPKQALVHAKNAGYLDPLEKGKYKLNSVGYNLVAHKMPASGTDHLPTRRKPAKKISKKAKR
jgi:hypothetical protein